MNGNHDSKGASSGAASTPETGTVLGRPQQQGASEDGIATAEFAIVALAAVGFAGLLVGILSSGDVRELLMGLVRQALSI